MYKVSDDTETSGIQEGGGSGNENNFFFWGGFLGELMIHLW